MTDDHSPDHTQDSDVSSNELDGVIHANKSLFDKLNQLPEIEALSSISIEEEEAEEKGPSSHWVTDTIQKFKGFYSGNELVRYAAWASVLILISTTALTIIEYDMFKESVTGHVGDTFVFGGDEPNWLHTFFHTFWWSIVTFTTVGYGDVTPITTGGRVFGAAITVVSVGMVALPAGILASAFSAQLAERQKIYETLVRKLTEDDGIIDDEEAIELEETRKTLGISELTASKIMMDEYQAVLRSKMQESCPHCGKSI